MTIITTKISKKIWHDSCNIKSVNKIVILKLTLNEMEGKMLDHRIKREDIGYLRLLIDLARLEYEKVTSKKNDSSDEPSLSENVNRRLALINFYL